MPVIVVGGATKGVGKTALVCGLIAALPGHEWVAVKITGHSHGYAEPVREESSMGQGTDTGRFLRAGARRAFLLTAADGGLPALLDVLWKQLGPGANIIFESNQVVSHVQPDICLAVLPGEPREEKPSFQLIAPKAHALVARAGRDAVDMSETPVFYLQALDQVSSRMQNWLRGRLAHG